MKDRKIFSLLIASVILFVIAIILLSVWGYSYLQNKNKTDTAATIKPSTGAASTVLRDSLQRNYIAAVNKLKTSLPAIQRLPDSSKKKADSNIQALYKLRDEIPALLSGKSTVNDLDSARFKISQLRQRIDELRNRTQEVEEENKRLNKALNQLKDQFQNRQTTYAAVPSFQPPAAIVEAQPVTINEARLWADDGAGGAATLTEQAKKFLGSFIVHKPKGSAAADIYIVVIQPDGHVLKVSDWESGAFETTEGRKMYSTKIALDDFKGESRRLSFALSGEDFQKGAYTLQLYQNGSRVGRATATLL